MVGEGEREKDELKYEEYQRDMRKNETAKEREKD